ncbi:DUF4241 domain-containing protein [Actinomyces qiguomingii]|uniref:DUF4241 domain-containing protein n=2 Tax=Actinomyces qiguomingii TaxID=2057800 RepID=UPI001E28DECA|nr:DUF4241 domain-containing protein [Actinomyces qiguomingii]
MRDTVTFTIGPDMDPRNRVEAFLADYAAAHARVKPLFYPPDDEDASADRHAAVFGGSRRRRRDKGDSGPDPFEAWSEAMYAVDTAHRTERSWVKRRYGFSSYSDYSPQTCKVERVEEYGNLARARMTRTGVPGGSIIEITLLNQAGDWLIDRIDEYHENPGQPLVPEDRRGKWLQAPDGMAPYEDILLSPEVDSPNPGALFHDGWARDPVDEFELAQRVDETEGPQWQRALAEAQRRSPVRRIRVQTIGSFPHGGLLAVGDAGSQTSMMYTCALRVRPGIATAQALLATIDTKQGPYERVAAVRAVLDDGEPVRWCAAALFPGVGTAVGVDSGTAAIVDAAAYISLTRRQWWNAWNPFPERRWEDMTMFDCGTGPIGVMTSSGWGDGTYAVYWGLDRDGHPLQLMIDYGVVQEAVASPLGQSRP